MNKNNIWDDDQEEEEDDWSAEAQGFDFNNPREWMEAMNLYDDEGDSCNDDGCFMGHDCFD